MRKKIRINIFCVHGHKYSRKYISLFVLDDDLAQTDLATYRANQAYLIMAHREREREFEILLHAYFAWKTNGKAK